MDLLLFAILPIEKTKYFLTERPNYPCVYIHYIFINHVCIILYFIFDFFLTFPPYFLRTIFTII